MTYKRFRTFIILLAGCIVLAFVYLYQWDGCPVNPIRSDGWGYYSYLPAIFDYKDLSFSFSREAIDTASIWCDINGNTINKYPVGVAVLQFPFFIVVDIFCKLFFPALATGYTAPYQAAVLCATTFYFLLGVFILYKVLWAHFSCKVTGWTLLSMLFGTSLFHYATYDASFSHVYSFFAVNAFVYVVRKCDINCGRISNNLLLGFLAGLILVLRNPNVVVLLFYILYGAQTFTALKNRIIQLVKPKRLLPNILGCALPVCLQCLYWYHATGSLVIRSYNESETFSWLTPHVVEVLFSVSKGLIFYSPLIGIAIGGIFVFRKTRKEFPLYGAALVIFIHLYITASWDCWQYGGSFGQRPFVDIYIFYALYLGTVYEYWDSLVLYNSEENEKRKPQTVLNLLLPIICVFLFMSLKFMLAYWHGILPFADATMQDIAHVWEWNFEEIRQKIQHVLQVL